MRRNIRSLAVPIGLLLLAPTARASQFELLSRAGAESDTATGLGDLPTDQQAPAVSADGRWIAFTSTAVNLAAGQSDLNGVHDVFLHDRQTGTTVLVSHAAGSPATAASGGGSQAASISDDGRWVVYNSAADDLVPGQVSNAWPQIHLYDRDTGINTLVSRSTAGPAVNGDGQSYHPRISGDGNWISFESSSSDLIAGQDTGGAPNIFLHERATGQTILVSRAAGTTLTGGDQQAFDPVLSRNGRWVAFRSAASNLVAGFSNGNPSLSLNTFLFDRVTGAMTLVSHAAGSATTGVGGEVPELSPDGAAVLFPSSATNLVPGQNDGNATMDLFLFDRASGTNVLVSHAPGSPTTSAGASNQPRDYQASSGGDWVVYRSWDAQLKSQIYLFRRSDSSVSLVSRSASSPGQGGNQSSLSPRLTPDGAFVTFASAATDLVPGQSGPPTFNVYLYNRVAGTLALASGSGGAGNIAGNHVSATPEVSDDGSVVAFYTWATDLVPGVADLNGTRDLALYDRGAAASVYATLHAPGQASATPSTHSTLVSASADGRYAVFLSTAVNVVPGQVDSNGGQDVFLVDRVAGTTTLVSHAADTAGLPTTTGDSESLDAAISADGAYVAFVSRGRDHVAGQIDTNLEDLGYGVWIPGPDVFLYDRAAGTTALVSHVAGSSVTAGEYPCYSDLSSDLSLSADGRYVAFGCNADDLVAGQVDPNFESDIFLYDRVGGTTLLVSRQSGTVTTTANSFSFEPAVSGDGRWVAFLSYATNLVAGSTDTNSQSDVFLFDRTTGQTLLVSRAAGTAATAASQRSMDFALSPDGRYLAFSSFATNLVPGQNGPASENVFLFDRATGVVELISRAAGTSTTAVTGAWNPSVSDDGRHVAFRSYGSNLVPGQTGPATANVFVHDRVTRQTELISPSVTSPQRVSNQSAQKPTLSPDGRYVAFVSRATDLASGSTGGDVYLADRQLQTLERVAEGPGTYFYASWTIPSTLPLLGPGGTVLFTSGGRLDVGDWNGADDVFAWVRSAPGTGDFFTLAPCRLIDTRQAGQGPALVNGVPAVVDVHGVCGIPSTARAIAINVTVLQAQGAGRLTFHPGNLSTPNTSTINFPAGLSLANNAILGLATNGEGTLGITPVVSGGGTVHVIVDVSGWFE